MTAPPLGRFGGRARAGYFAGVVGSAIAALVLSACSVFDKGTEPRPCPKASVLQDAANITRFVAGGGRDLIDVVFEGQIIDASGTCKYDLDKKTETGNLAIELTVTFDVARGPANRDRQAALKYFVAITDKERQILTRQPFTGNIEFPENQSRVRWTDEPIYMNIPLKAKQTGGDFLIYLGLDLTHDEVEFNRRQLREIRR